MQQLFLQILAVALLLLAYSSTAAATDPPHANCSLLMQGFGAGMRRGIAFLKLHCVTSDGAPVQVSMNTTWIGKFASDVKGVVIQSTPLGCLHSDESHPTRSLLYFCSGGHVITLQAPRVHDVWWEGVFDGSATSLVFLGPYAHVQIVNGTFSDNLVPAGAVLRSIGAALSIAQSSFEQNAGSAGTAVSFSDGDELQIDSSSFAYNTASSRAGSSSIGAAVLVDNCKHAVFSECTWHNNRVSGGGGAAALVTRNSSVAIFGSKY